MDSMREVIAAAGLVAVVVTGCGSDAVTLTSEASGSDRSSAEARLGADLPISPLEREEKIYQSVDEIASVSTVIVSGTVSAVDSLGYPEIGEAPASEYFLITVTPTTTVKGDIPNEVSFAWEGFGTKPGAGEERIRTTRVVQAGVSMPDVGDELLLFLAPEDQQREAFFGRKDLHQVVTLDGILYVDDGILTTQLIDYGKARAASSLDGRPLEEVINSLRTS
jgi:hypothetical protein